MFLLRRYKRRATRRIHIIHTCKLVSNCKRYDSGTFERGRRDYTGELCKAPRVKGSPVAGRDVLIFFSRSTSISRYTIDTNLFREGEFFFILLGTRCTIGEGCERSDFFSYRVFMIHKRSPCIGSPGRKCSYLQLSASPR